MRQTILFVDIDSTLVENRFSRKVLGVVLRDIAAVTGKELREIGRELGAENDRRQKTDPDNILTMDWQDITQSVAARYGVTLSASVDALWDEYATAEGVEVLDNAPGVFQRLKHNGRTLVIATKGLTKYQLPVLRVAGLLPLFDDVLTPDTTGYLKTSPAYFDRYRAQYPAALFIQVGDHYYDDVICAKRNDFYSVLRAPIPELQPFDPFERPSRLLDYREQIATYPPDGTDILPDAVVISLEELPGVIGQIEAIN